MVLGLSSSQQNGDSTTSFSALDHSPYNYAEKSVRTPNLEYPSTIASRTTLTKSYSNCANAAFPSTKAKIESLNERIAGFEKQLENDARLRKENDAGRIGAIRDTIDKLEKTLASEIKRRSEAQKSLQSVFETHVSSVEEKIEHILGDKLDQLQMAVETMMERMASIEKEFDHERQKIFKNEEERTHWIKKEVSSRINQYEVEKQNKKEKEQQINKKIEDLEMKIQTKLEELRATREGKFEALTSAFEEEMKLREKNDEKLANYIFDEIATLKEALVAESQAREAADDDIVQAVNHYTKALQDALRLINAL